MVHFVELRRTLASTLEQMEADASCLTVDPEPVRDFKRRDCLALTFP